MIALKPDTTILRNVHIEGNGGDPLALKRSLARLLDVTNFQPAGLPPDACLVVRHLSDPLPGKLRLAPDALLPSVAWEHAMQQALEAQARHAARPVLGTIPSDAPAVLFADRAELLACLAADFLAGLLSSHWWWRSLFSNADLRQATLAAWRDSPEHLPAALDLLARRGQAVTFVRALDAGTTRQILTGLIHRFGLSVLGQVFKVAPGAFAPDFPTPRSTPVKQSGLPAPAPPVPSAPWHSLVPESTADGLSIEQQAVLGIALTLRRAPTLAHSRDFSKAVDTWQHATFLSQNAGPTQTPNLFEPDANPAGKSVSLQGIEPASLIPDPAGTPTAGTSSNRPDKQADSDPTSGQEFVEKYIHQPDVQPAPRTLSQTVEAPAEILEDQHQPAIEPERIPGLELTPILPAMTQPILNPSLEEAPLVETAFTRFGGLFYLLNLAQTLGLYADFSAPLNPGLTLSPWDFLALVGREMLGPPLEADPLWPLLARLAGRNEGQPPGQGFEPPDGLPLLRWLEQTTSQIRWQLLLTLRLDQQDALRDLFFAQPARIEQSASRLDIFFSLENHPIQIRLAGLDRNPWWIPAAGRFVVYHYD